MFGVNKRVDFYGLLSRKQVRGNPKVNYNNSNLLQVSDISINECLQMLYNFNVVKCSYYNVVKIVCMQTNF